MLRFTPEAGGRVADRYRLEECIEKYNGTSTWQALDEKLVRPVTLQIMDADNELAEAVLAAAQAASSINDGRFLRVLDAARRDSIVYVVNESLPGARRLSEALAADGPLEPMDAQMLIVQTAEAMATAHAAGLVHLRLQPDTLLLTGPGQVKIAGLCVDAALHQTSVPDPSAGDARALGRIFYAALTGKWPDGEAFGLPAAPFEHGSICTPRQVRAGVSDAMDALVDRMVNFNPRAGHALRSPAEVASALRQLPRPRPSAAAGPDTTGPMSAVTGILAPMPTPDGWKPSAATRGIQFAVVAMLGLGLVLLAFQIFRTLHPSNEPEAAQGTGPMQGIRVTSVRAFDPPPGDGGENGDQARLAVDGKATTSWRTLTYRSADLGSQKPGVGLVLDLGRPMIVRQVSLTLVGEGADVQIRAASPSVTEAPPDTASYFVAAAKDDTDPGETLRFAFAARTRFLLVWLVQLPKDPDGDGYRGGIAEIRVSG